MARDYQRQRDNPYLLPEYLYKTIKYTIRDYDRMREEYQNILFASPAPPDGMPRGSKTGTPTEDKAVRLAVLSKHLECIDMALAEIPCDYQRGVLNEARYGGGFPTDAGIATYKRWKQKFVYLVAKNMKLT